MNIISHPQTVSTSPRPHVRSSAEGLLDAAAQITSLLERGKAVGTADLRQVMIEAFGGSDAEGFWLWKDVYEATEAAQVMFLRKFGAAIQARANAPQSVLRMLTKVARLVPTHTRRSDESQALQQLSTPMSLGLIASRAAGIMSGDIVLEPSAGTGLLAIFAELSHARLVLNEYAAVRHSLLSQIFTGVSVSQHDAAHIDDYLDRTVRPTVVLMNPPFSAGLHVEGRVTDAAWRHLASAFARLAPGGRLVAITGSGLSPDNRSRRDAAVRLQGQGTVLFSAPIDGGIYARHGTTTETRLTVIDKIPADDPVKLVASKGTAPNQETLLAWISGLPPRSPSPAPTSIGTLSDRTHRQIAAKTASPRAAGAMQLASVLAPSHRPAAAAGVPRATVERLPPVNDEIIELSYEPHRLIATNVKAERRFLSTIARRLDTLGAITRGQRQTGGQGMFRSEDNLESQYARDALRQFYGLLHAGRIEGCSLDKFESITGLSLTSEEGGLKDELPPIHTFLNRMLALTIAMQNVLFEAFEQLLATRIEGAIAAGIYDKGLETITADSMTVTDRRLIYTHPVTGAQSHLLTIERRDPNAPMQLRDVQTLVQQDPRAKLMINGKSGRPAVMVPTRSIMLEDGSVQPRVSLIRPMDELRFEVRQLEETSWEEADEQAFAVAWNAEVAAVPEFSTSMMHIVSGLLLPIWRLLPQDFCRVLRLRTDDGERIVGRVIAPDRLAGLCRNFEIDQTEVLSGDEAWTALVDGSSIIGLAGDMTLRRVRVMNEYRVELTGFTDGMRDWLRSIRLFSEMINWKLRFFVPVTDEGAEILSKLMQRHRLIDLARRS
jgi:predicted RNA methylase